MRVLIALAVAVLVCPSALAQGHGQRHAPNASHERGQGRMAPRNAEARGTIHALLADHGAIERRVEDIPGGVESWTTSADTAVAVLIRRHVRQMKARLESGQPIRRWDPLFAAVFEHADAIDMTIEDIEGGVHVVEVSSAPEVVALIRQHAHRAVSEFVEGGMERAHQPTPLPETDSR